MKKNSIYIITLISLLIIAYFVTRDDSGSNVSERAFAVKKIDQIDKIFLSKKDGRQILLTKTNNQWTVNNKYTVRKGAIDKLLQTMKSLRVEYPVPETMIDNVIKNMSSEAIKVEVYSQETLLKTYYVGGEAVGYKGTYMLMDEAETPYVVDVPAFNGYLTVRYIMDELEWRDRTIFAYQIDEIKQLSVSYTEDSAKSFQFTIHSSDSISMYPTPAKAVIKGRPRKYIDQYQFIASEAILESPRLLDSLRQNKPFAIITVEDITSFKNKVKVYYKPVDKRTKMQSDTQGNPMKYDTDRYYAILNNDKTLVVIQDQIFRNLLLPASVFYE